MIMSAGAIGGLVTGVQTLLDVMITQKRDAEREKENHEEEARRTLIEKPTQSYTNYMSEAIYIHTQLCRGQNPTMKEWKKMYKFATEGEMLGSPKIISMFQDYPNDWIQGDKMVSYYNELIRLMAEEVQGFDVYKGINQPREQETTLKDT
jgi:hypothetical protein